MHGAPLPLASKPMSDTTTKMLEIVLKGRDDGLTSLLDKTSQKANTLAQQLRQGGDIGELSGVKKFGKNIGEFLGTSQAGDIGKGAAQLRNQLAAEYADRVKAILGVERQAEIVDKARTGAMLERSQAAATLQRQLAAINAEERKALSKGATGLLKGEYGPAEIRDEAKVSRAAAEKAYQDVLARTVDVQMRAAKSDGDRRAAILAKAEATRQYAKSLADVDKAEKEALKQNASANRLTRGIAVAGGTLAAVNIAGGIAEAWDKANQKIEEGKIGANEFVGEFAKGLPIIGSTVQKAESLMLVISGYGKALRDANAQAAELDKTIAGQNATRKRADDLISGLTGINDTDKQRIVRETKKKLKEIDDAIAAGKSDGSINEGSDRFKGLQKARADVIIKQNKELGEIEAREREVRAKKMDDIEKKLAEERQAEIDAQTKKREEEIKAAGKREAAAERAAAILKDEQEKMLADAKDAAGRNLSTYQTSRTSLFDGRGQTNYYNQGKMFAPLEEATKKTADNTKTTNDKLDKLIAVMSQGGGNGTFIQL